jgi:hypothetical protein
MMTAVSPLVPHNKDIALKSLPGEPDPGQAATSFAQLLDNRKDDAKAHARTAAPHAYSFAGLGMFGLHASEFVADSKDVAQVSATRLLPMDAINGGRDRSQATRSQAAPPLIHVPSLKVDAPEGVADQQQFVVRSISKPALEGKAVGSVAIAAAETESGGVSSPRAGGGAATVPTLSKPAPDRVSVTVSGPDEALTIAVRSTGEPAPEVVRVRRLIETTVAQFEMAIAELHFNGKAASPAFSIGGGMNGSSAR